MRPPARKRARPHPSRPPPLSPPTTPRAPRPPPPPAHTLPPARPSPPGGHSPPPRGVFSPRRNREAPPQRHFTGCCVAFRKDEPCSQGARDFVTNDQST